MSYFGSGVEYGLHCLLYLVDGGPGGGPGGAPSARDLAEFQGVSPSYVAKLFTKLEHAGLIASAEGVDGGYRLARPASQITVLDVSDAIEGTKPLFRCREVRANCILYDGRPPAHATKGMCAIHAAMREAETKMRESLARTTLADLAGHVAKVVPDTTKLLGAEWFRERRAQRRRPPHVATTDARA
jgi:Rrf2 family protein